jgi:hypothetical protein
VGVGLLQRPAVDAGQVRPGLRALALDVGEPDVLDLMAGRAQRDHPNEHLHAGPVVVAPHLVALHRVFRAFAAADLAAVVGLPVDLPADAIPAKLIGQRADVVVPARLGHQLHREPGRRHHNRRPRGQGWRGRAPAGSAAAAGGDQAVQAASPGPAVEHAAGLGFEFSGGGHVAPGERQRPVDGSVVQVGELARLKPTAGLVGADGADVGPRPAEGERVTDPAAEVVGQLVILAKLAGRLVRLHLLFPLLLPWPSGRGPTPVGSLTVHVDSSAQPAR